MTDGTSTETLLMLASDTSIGRIVSVTGSKAIVLLDGQTILSALGSNGRPEMGTLLAIDTATTVVLAIVSALSVPVPAQRDGEAEIWIAELGLVGELWRMTDRESCFNRGVTIYPALGDRVRVAAKAELELAFCGTDQKCVRIGSLRQDNTIPAMVRVDDLLGKHFAILGTTGTGKSCTTALILRSILEQNPNAHIVLLDPHNEYATAFKEYGEVISPRNMQLPFWLLTFEEIVEVLIGDPNRKPEIELLQELIPVAKSKYAAGRNGPDPNARLRRGGDTGRYSVDTPVPYRISDLTAMLDDRMGKLENKRDLAPYRNLKSRIDQISQDARYAFMFGSLTVYDGMAQVLGRIFRVPVAGKPITILELTGLPTEIINVVVSVLCRMTFDFAVWAEGEVPVTLVCEEAHRYVPANPAAGFEPCKRAIAKIAKEGRKYGASLCIVTQRPAEIDPTILSQCNTVFALRMSNDKDQNIVQSAVSDTGSGLLEFLPALGQREAIAFGDGVSLPVRIKFDELPKAALPRSSSAKFSERWQKSVGDEGFLEQIVERWRSAGISNGDQSGLAMLAESFTVPGNETPPESDEPGARASQPPLPPLAPQHSGTLQRDQMSNGGYQQHPGAPRGSPQLRKDQPPAPSRGGAGMRRATDTVTATADPAPGGESIRSLRDKLMQRTAR
ncbi:MAG: ATP-binding protein [Hyphomicrobiaceae bacterium]|nr:ATP-binding protein [Hyphomicrobiaceae bacterium]